MLAHRASFQGKIAAEVIAGLPSAYEAVAVPSVIFSDPEIAVVGLSEAEAQDQGMSVKVGMFPFRALGRALTVDDKSRGFVRVISESGISSAATRKKAAEEKSPGTVTFCP